MPEISVIIPVYNAGRAIVRCLKSISRQTFTDFEIILLNDGSTDDSLNLARRIIDSTSVLKERTRIIDKENSGVADTRNLAISLAEGEFLAFIDQDDFIARDYLEKYYKTAVKSPEINGESQPVDIVVGGYERVASDGRIMMRVIPAPSDWAGYIVTAPWAHLYRRDFIVENRIQFLKNKIGEDVYFNVVALNSGAKVAVLNDAGYKWFYNDKSVSNSVQNTFKEDVDAIYLMDQIYEGISEHNRSVLKEGTYSSKCLEYFFLRYVCWYMLFSSRGSKKAAIRKVYDNCFSWIRVHYPSYRHNSFIGIRMPKGENIKFHTFVLGFYTLEKLGLLKPFLVLFGKR